MKLVGATNWLGTGLAAQLVEVNMDNQTALWDGNEESLDTDAQEVELPR